MPPLLLEQPVLIPENETNVFNPPSVSLTSLVDDDSPLYVNAKQYYRIMQRRLQRQKNYGLDYLHHPKRVWFEVNSSQYIVRIKATEKLRA